MGKQELSRADWSAMSADERPEDEAEVVADDDDLAAGPAEDGAENDQPEAEGPDFEAHAGWGTAG